MRKAATQNKLRKEREKARKMLLLVVEWEREIYSTKAKKMVPLVLDFCCVLLVVEWEVVRESFKKKAAILLDFVQIPPPPSPSPQFGRLVQLFLNAKSVDLSGIQNVYYLLCRSCIQP